MPVCRIVDQSVCRGHGLCCYHAPEIFDIRETDGRAVVRVEVVAAALARAMTIVAAEATPGAGGRDA